MTKRLKIFMLCGMALAMIGCRDSLIRRNEGQIVAKVGDAVLMRSDLVGIDMTEVSAEDSLKLLEAYVNSWIRKQLKLQEAEKVLEKSGYDIEAMVADYRMSLMINQLDQYFVERRLDTLLTDESIETYYERHKSEFPLERAIVKGRIVQVPNSYRQPLRIKELMASQRSDRQKDFVDICEKNRLKLTEFDYWIDYGEFLSCLPVVRDKDYDEMLVVGKIQEMSDAENRYFIQINDFRRRGDTVPLEKAKDMVRQIIYNRRSREVIKNYEDSLYKAAENAGSITININNNQ